MSNLAPSNLTNRPLFDIFYCIERDFTSFVLTVFSDCFDCFRSLSVF